MGKVNFERLAGSELRSGWSGTDCADADDVMTGFQATEQRSCLIYMFALRKASFSRPRRMTSSGCSHDYGSIPTRIWQPN